MEMLKLKLVADITDYARGYIDLELDRFNFERLKEPKTIMMTKSSILYVSDLYLGFYEEIQQKIEILKNMGVEVEKRKDYIILKNYCVVNAGGSKYIVEGSTAEISSLINEDDDIDM